MNSLTLCISLVWFVCATTVSARCWGDSSTVIQPPYMTDTSSCFSGEFASADSFLSSVEAGRSELSPEAKVDVRADYARWRTSYSCTWFQYSVDKLSVRGFVIKPASVSANRRPVVIFNRGGNADDGAIDFSYILGKLGPIVDAGFIVVGSLYRGAKVSDGTNPDRLKDEFGGQDINDVLGLLPLVDAMPDADGRRIAIWGKSRGGMMAYIAARRSDRFATLIAESAPTDLQMELKFRPAMVEVLRQWVPKFDEDPKGALMSRSAVLWANELNPKMSVLILHGAGDTSVSTESALEMAGRLQALHRPYRLVIFENGSHSLREYDDAVAEEITKWLKYKLNK